MPKMEVDISNNFKYNEKVKEHKDQKDERQRDVSL
jgi:hypothetical protein